jgi:hypothetical protein
MRLAVVHNAVTDQSAPDERDVLVQADAVQAALKDLRHETELLPCTLNLASVQARLQAIRPDIVFNLVESLNGQGRLIHLFPALLDAIAMPYTGADSQALYFTSNKILAKRQMVQAGLPTPPWIGPYPPDMAALAQPTLPGPALNFKDRKIRWLVKSVWEHASVGLDECELTLSESVEEVLNRLPRQAAPLGGSCFAEAYIEGREFNLSLLAGPNGPEYWPRPKSSLKITLLISHALWAIAPNGQPIPTNTTTPRGVSTLRRRMHPSCRNLENWPSSAGRFSGLQDMPAWISVSISTAGHGYWKSTLIPACRRMPALQRLSSNPD